jgi:hypothetical protein
MIEFTSRYEALGMPLPDRDTMCRDQCEGTGWVPCKQGDEEPWRSLWPEAEAINPNPPDDDWHFVRCPSCGGTGKRA